MRNTLLRMLGCGLLAAAATAQSPSSDVSVGVFPFLVGNMDSRVNEIVTNCQTYGIDTLYISAFRTTGPSQGDLWITDSAGDWNAGWGPVRSTGAGINLQTLITACHAANVRVVPVIKCFSDNVQPDNAAHRQYLLQVIDYFLDAWQPNGQPVYDIDGIALDYVRYVGGTNVQAANVTNFVRDVKQRLGSLSLHAYLIASRYTFDGPVYNSQFASYSATIASFASQYGQHWEQMAAHVDVLMPMAYSADGSIYNTYAGHQAYVRQAASYARTAATIAGYPARRVVPTIKTYTGESE
ncbi:MAG: putative glycosyl hydrolase domain, partial [Planctomycetota bacterium]